MARRFKALHDTTLKVAIIESGKTQKRVAIETRLGEVRLSDIVRGSRKPATADEQRRIAKAIGRRVADVFPADVIAAARADQREEAAS
jgi:transcriptional regulator with XRE-family HTH domain